MKLKTVKWYDAVQKDIDEGLLKHLSIKDSGKEFLAINTSYGEVIKLKHVIIVVKETSTDGDHECVVIPKDWVISIT